MANLDLQRTERNDNRVAFICIFLVSLICDHFAEQPLRGGDLGSCRSRSARALSCFGFYCPFTDCHLRILLILLQQQTLSIYICATPKSKKRSRLGTPSFCEMRCGKKKKHCVSKEDIHGAHSERGPRLNFVLCIFLFHWIVIDLHREG